MASDLLFVGRCHPNAEFGDSPSELANLGPWDFSKSQLENLELTHLPLTYEHDDDKAVGLIKNTYTGKDGAKYIVGVIDCDHPVGRDLAQGIETGDFGELSLKHVFREDHDPSRRVFIQNRRPTRVGITKQGARPNCKIARSLTRRISKDTWDKNHRWRDIVREVLKNTKGETTSASTDESTDKMATQVPVPQGGAPSPGTPGTPQSQPPGTPAPQGQGQGQGQQQAQAQQTTTQAPAPSPPTFQSQDEFYKYATDPEYYRQQGFDYDQLLSLLPKTVKQNMEFRKELEELKKEKTGNDQALRQRLQNGFSRLQQLQKQSSETSDESEGASDQQSAGPTLDASLIEDLLSPETPPSVRNGVVNLIETECAAHSAAVHQAKEANLKWMEARHKIVNKERERNRKLEEFQQQLGLQSASNTGRDAAPGLQSFDARFPPGAAVTTPPERLGKRARTDDPPAQGTQPSSTSGSDWFNQWIQ